MAAVAAPAASRASLVARTASGTTYERMREDAAAALDIESQGAASSSDAPLAPPPPWWRRLRAHAGGFGPALRSMLHHAPQQLSRQELDAQVDDCALPRGAAAACCARARALRR
jgi:hypothetical protein